MLYLWVVASVFTELQTQTVTAQDDCLYVFYQLTIKAVCTVLICI